MSRPRTPTSATASLLSIALALEAVLVLFVTLAAFGLRAVSPPLAFGGGAALIVLLTIAARLVRRPAGIGLGWLLQVILLATGLVLPIMYFIGAGFVAIWVFCFVKGRQLDRAKAAAPDPEDPESPGSTTKENP